MTLRQCELCELTNPMTAFCQVSPRQTGFHLHQLSVSKDLFSQLRWSSHQIRLASKRANIKQVRTNSGLANSDSNQQSQQFLNCNIKCGKNLMDIFIWNLQCIHFRCFFDWIFLQGKPQQTTTEMALETIEHPLATGWNRQSPPAPVNLKSKQFRPQIRWKHGPRHGEY